MMGPEKQREDEMSKNRIELDISEDYWNNIVELQKINGELLKCLDFLVRAAETEPGMSIYKAHIQQASAAIKKAKGG